MYDFNCCNDSVWYDYDRKPFAGSSLISVNTAWFMANNHRSIAYLVTGIWYLVDNENELKAQIRDNLHSRTHAMRHYRDKFTNDKFICTKHTMHCTTVLCRYRISYDDKL